METVSHKYGEEAADLALDATHATGDLLTTAKTVKGVYSGKKFAKKLGKKAAQESVKTYFVYDEGQAQVLQIEDGVKNKATKLIEGIPNMEKMGDGETEEFFDADEEFTTDRLRTISETSSADVIDKAKVTSSSAVSTASDAKVQQAEANSALVTKAGSNDNDDDSDSELFGDANEEFES